MKELVLFESGLYSQEDIPEDYGFEDDALNSIMQSIKVIFEPSILVGTVGRWNGTFNGYKYCHDFNGFQHAVSGYDYIIIRQMGTRLCFTLCHHDGRHEMELRRFNDYGYDNLNNVCLDYFNEYALRFINRYTKNFGKITGFAY